MNRPPSNSFHAERARFAMRPGRVLGGILAGLLLAGSAVGGAGGEEGGPVWELLPDDASVRLAVPARTDAVSAESLTGWTRFVLETVEETVAPIGRSWSEARDLLSELVPSSGSCLHAVGDGGRSWIQVVRWEDPISLEENLRRLRPRPMGAGRFRLAEPAIDLMVSPPWLLAGPRDCRWFESTAGRLRGLETFGGSSPLDVDDGHRPLEVWIRHSQPVGGGTHFSIHPIDANAARVEVVGEYDASPLPIRGSQKLERSALAGFEGRLAFAVQENGIGLLDPLIVEHASSIPALVPDVELRQRFAPRRIVVIDGESVVLQGVGPIEVPAVCVAVPLRDALPSATTRPELQRRVDQWLESAGMAVRATWDPSDRSTCEVMRRGDIRHLSLGSGLLEAAGGHPMAMGASLDWTLRVDGDGDAGWVVVGSAPGLVRRVAEALDREISSSLDESAPAVGMHGVASPARLALQLRDLALLRRGTIDPTMESDVATLDRFSGWMSRLDRIRWETTLQDERDVRARLWVHLANQSAGGDAGMKVDEP